MVLILSPCKRYLFLSPQTINGKFVSESRGQHPRGPANPCCAWWGSASRVWAFSPCRAGLYPRPHAWSEALLGVCPHGAPPISPSCIPPPTTTTELLLPLQPLSYPARGPSAPGGLLCQARLFPMGGKTASLNRAPYQAETAWKDQRVEGREGIGPLQSWVQFKCSPSEDAALHLSSPLASAVLPWPRTVEELAV